MAHGPLEMVKETILETLPRLKSDDLISVISFDDEATVDVPLRTVADHNMAEVTKIVAALRDGGSTNLELGYKTALEEAKKAPSGVETSIILLSDGHANSGEVNPQVLGKLATAATEHFISTSTIGIGQSYDENIMSALADGGNGNHVAAIELAEAVDGLQAEIDGLLQKTMLDVKIKIALGPDFSGKNSNIIAGRRMKKWKLSHGRVESTLGDVASGEQKNVVFDLILDSHELAEPGVKTGVKVDLEYTDVLTGKKVTDSQTFDVELVSAEEWVEPVRDEDIVAELKLVRLQQVRDQAMRLYNEGKDKEADALLEAAGIELDLFMNTTNLSPRQLKRMRGESTNLMSYMQMDDLNIKKKRLNEHTNRSARDRKDFRDKDSE
jgi:Ca-activated chloride channel family protein